MYKAFQSLCCYVYVFYWVVYPSYSFSWTMICGSTICTHTHAHTLQSHCNRYRPNIYSCLSAHTQSLIVCVSCVGFFVILTATVYTPPLLAFHITQPPHISHTITCLLGVKHPVFSYQGTFTQYCLAYNIPLSEHAYNSICLVYLNPLWAHISLSWHSLSPVHVVALCSNIVIVQFGTKIWNTCYEGCSV